MPLFGFFHRNKDGIETPLEIENAMTDNDVKPAETPAPKADAAALATGILRVEDSPAYAEQQAKIAKLEADATRRDKQDAQRREDETARASAAFAASLVKDVRIPAADAPKAAGFYARLAAIDHEANAEPGAGLLDGLKQFCDLIPAAAERFTQSTKGKAVFSAEGVPTEPIEGANFQGDTPNAENVARLMKLAGVDA